MEQTITFTYLKHRVEIKLPDPEEDNTIYTTIYREEGTYDPELYNAYLCDYQFSATSDDPNNWLIEAVKTAVTELGFRGINYSAEDLEPDVDDSLPQWADHYSNESDYWIAEHPEALNSELAFDEF